MYINVTIECYEECGQNWVYLSTDSGSGAKYVYEDKEELKEIVNDFINDLIDEE